MIIAVHVRVKRTKMADTSLIESQLCPDAHGWHDVLDVSRSDHHDDGHERMRQLPSISAGMLANV